MISNRKRPWLLASSLFPAFPNLPGPPTLSERQTWEASTHSAAAGNVSMLVAGNMASAVRLYRELRKDSDTNLVFSPYSISLALAMTYAGACGDTETQMAEALSFGLDQATLHKTFGALSSNLVERGNAEANEETYENARALRIANALWGEQSYPFSEDFRADLERDYGAGMEEVDLLNAQEEAREEINAWVADHAEDHIQDIVPPNAIDRDILLVLANAIYFSGVWMEPFDPDETHDDDFTLLDGNILTVPFMYQHDRFLYARADGYQVIQFHYAGDMGAASDFALTVILPDEGQFEAFEEALDADALESAIDQLTWTEEVRVWLPPFRFEFGTTSLKPALQAMGITDAFDPARADFTGMVEGTPPVPLMISDVLHKALIDVDEEGTEAAAATIVLIVPGASANPPTPPPPIEVRIDRPFLFAIRDTVTGTILFLGRVMDPRESGLKGGRI